VDRQTLSSGDRMAHETAQGGMKSKEAPKIEASAQITICEKAYFFLPLIIVTSPLSTVRTQSLPSLNFEATSDTRTSSFLNFCLASFLIGKVLSASPTVTVILPLSNFLKTPEISSANKPPTMNMTPRIAAKNLRNMRISPQLG